MPPGVRRALGVGLAGLIGVLLAAQLVLPRIAETRLRHRLEHVGTVERVQIGAFPALKLLFGHADRVTVRMRDSSTGPAGLADLLARARQTARLDASVAALHVGPLTFRQATLRKRGRELTGAASVTHADLRAALPPGFEVAPVASGGGALVFAASATLLGHRVTARAVALARGGRLLVAPDVPFGGLLTLTVFSDPRVYVEGVDAQPRAGGFTLGGRAKLTD